MDLTAIIVTIGGVLLIFATLWFFFGKAKTAGKPAGPQKNYACPMHPWITSPDPTATCSICGMKLVLEESKRGAGGRS